MNRRPYRFVIRSYPTYYRREHGDELIQTALALNDGRWQVREAAAFVRSGLAMSVRDVRRLWVLLAIPAILYGPAIVLFVVTHDQSVVHHSHLLADVSRVLKIITVLGLPVLLKLLVARTTEQPDRWKRSFVVWSAVGVVSVLGLSLVRADFATLSNSTSTWANYPGGPDPHTGFSAAPSLAALLVREVIAVVIIAAAAAWLSKRSKAPVFTVSAATLLILCGYLLLAPWAFVLDYDTFVGDTMLGATFGEVLFLVTPFDGFGALALSASALVMTSQILAWGGATATARARSDRAVAQASL